MSSSKQRRAERRRMADVTANRDGLQNVAAGLGTTRDKMAYSAYGTPIVLSRDALENMYRSSWLAKKIVNIPAEDMTRAWRQVMFDDDQIHEQNQFAIEEAERALCIPAKVTEAIKWARLYGGAALILGVGSDRNYEKPLDPASVKKGDLRFVQVLDRWMCIPEGNYDWNIESDNFGLPEYYRIATQNGPRVHYSRVIRFVGQKLPYWAAMQQARWGDSELQAVYDTMIGRDTITAAIATMMFEANVDVIKAPDLADILASQDGEAKLTKRFQVAGLMKSFNRMLLLDGAEEYEKKSNSFSGLDSIMKEFRSEVAGAADIPVSRLFGLSVGGLNATGDNEVRNYYDMVAARQNEQLRPQLERLDEVLIRSTLGTMPDDYRFEFKPLWQMDETEAADVEKKRAERDKIYFDMGVLTEGVIARELKESGTYSTMTEGDVELAEELAEAMPPDERLAAQAEAEAEANQPGAEETEEQEQ